VRSEVGRSVAALATIALLVVAPVATTQSRPIGAYAVAAEPAAGDPQYPSDAWFEREARNYARTQEAPQEQAEDPVFQQRWREQSLENYRIYLERQADGTWPWESRGNLCQYWSEPCTGDPFRYPGVDPFYTAEGEVAELAFFDAEGTLLSGRVWAPRDAAAGDALPGVVIVTGSVQAPETLYWWFAQTLVRQGYVVMTFDVRGQGRSDNRAPDGTPGTNFNPDVFATDLVAAIDLFRSTPDAPYPPNEEHAGTRDTAGLLASHNPFWDRLDQDRLGIIGHSLGAAGASVVQGWEPWPGPLGGENPVDVLVAWDNLTAEASAGSGASLGVADVVPRVPAMGQAGDYYLTPTPHERPPDPDEEREAFLAWRDAGVPAYQVNVRGGTHYEWSLLPGFPTTSWHGWGNPMAGHFSLAWLDRWLKAPDEPGYDTAEARLLADAEWCDRMSFYYRSSRELPLRSGGVERSEDIRRDCSDESREGGGDDAGGTPGTEEPSGAPSHGEGAGVAPGTAPDAPSGPAHGAVRASSSGTASTLPSTGAGAAFAAVALMLSAARLAEARRPYAPNGRETCRG
jgi:hypothetical protein